MATATRIPTETEIDVEPAAGEAAGDVDIAAAAALMADPSRAAVLIELTDGRALPPSELAEVAGVSRSTISEHLRASRSVPAPAPAMPAARASAAARRPGSEHGYDRRHDHRRGQLR